MTATTVNDLREWLKDMPGDAIVFRDDTEESDTMIGDVELCKAFRIGPKESDMSWWVQSLPSHMTHNEVKEERVGVFIQ